MTAGTSETSASARVTVLVGHGVPAKGTPPEQVARLKALEGARRRSGTAMMSDEEARLDAAIRVVPRTPENDPYDAGLRRLADALAKRLAPEPVLVAFNEFCAPSLRLLKELLQMRRRNWQFRLIRLVEEFDLIVDVSASAVHWCRG